MILLKLNFFHFWKQKWSIYVYFIFSTIYQILKTTFSTLWRQTCKNLKSIKFTYFPNACDILENTWIGWFMALRACDPILQFSSYYVIFLSINYWLRSCGNLQAWPRPVMKYKAWFRPSQARPVPDYSSIKSWASKSGLNRAASFITGLGFLIWPRPGPWHNFCMDEGFLTCN